MTKPCLKISSELLLHQIRNSGQVLSGGLEMLAQGGQRESELIIGHEIQNLYRFINQFHAHQVPTSHRITFSPKEIMENLMSAFSKQYRRFDFKFCAPSRTERLLKCSVFEFETLIGLLLDNAVRYTPKGQKIECYLETWPAGQASWIEIKNFGIGLSPKQQTEIFTRNKKEKNGLGLGLPLAKHLAQKNGFQLTVQSDGTSFVCFKLLFPFT